MKEITSITDRSKQKFNLVLENNETVEFNLYYSPRQQAWFYDFTYNDITCNGSKVVLSPNALRQFKKNIPFGIAFIAASYVEPFALDDFSSGRVSMFILNEEEVQQIESSIYNLW